MSFENPMCAIRLLERLEEDIEKDTWANTDTQKNVFSGVRLAKRKLEQHGFIKMTEDELAVVPVQTELALDHVDYGTLRSQH